mmetsp:Transcript_19495/g.28461  ORF Transcript_19495/g.28461 Transcript_19495/m.28461 type:complete len:248 (-) Transcript_19495:113-856(-)|eukprot:CAMPEP_0197247150 /NCGR_PEP_ID=MMETSP1429-20130617/26136_1 /TAXON_ID=49237 /ORGANISM="Chaetoceros  sp., Strain UNC1202" /LENGTH=247 /DNA_ID=CAMNT_0042707987 /DNA_START=50 /DNA_END=793 /DNA_ORIENTATION=+
MQPSSSSSASLSSPLDTGDLSTSPPSVLSPLFHSRKLHSRCQLSLEEFIELIPNVIRNSQKKQSLQKGGGHAPKQVLTDDDDPVANLFRRLDMTEEEMDHYSFIESHKNYTRNLIATDHQTFTLLLLCWNPNKSSPIHDHPCDGCWMRVLKGTVNEKRYVENKVRDGFVCTMDSSFQEGSQTFINDNMGYHKIGNEGSAGQAISIHLYSPPFQKCKIWMDENDIKATTSRVCHFSEYGHLVSHSDAA